MTRVRTIIALAAAVGPMGLVSAAPAQYEVTSLPGWNGPLLSKMYCGFSAAGTPPIGVVRALPEAMTPLLLALSLLLVWLWLLPWVVVAAMSSRAPGGVFVCRAFR
jgi:hypothetical protein